MNSMLARFDAYQQSRPWLAFLIGLGKKFSDDRAGYLATLVAYYGFFSLFPLLLVLVSALGFVLGENSGFRQKVLDSVLSQIPVIGSQLNNNIQGIQGSGLALVIGLAGTLLAGMGVILSLQHGMDQIWTVPVQDRPKFLIARLRALLMLGVLGLGAVASTVVSSLGSSGKGVVSLALVLLGVAGSVALNFGLFMVAFRVLTSAEVGWREVMPGAAVGALSWALLQALGGYIVRNQLTRASDVYGFFAIVIGLLSWLYVGARMTYLAAEINVVKARHLWPRSLDLNHPTKAEKTALAGLATQEQRHPSEQIDVAFQPARSPADWRQRRG